MAARGLRGTFHINSGLVGANPYFMTWAEIQQVAAAGNEIAGHTLNDDGLLTLPANQRRPAVCDDRANLIAHGYNPVTFAYPHGQYDASVQAIVRDCGYASARRVGGLWTPGECTNPAECTVAEGIPPADPYAIRSNPAVTGPITLAELQRYVTQAGGSGWVPLSFHDICDLPCTGRDPNGSVSPADFGQFLTFLQSSGAVVRTVREVVLPSSGSPPPPPGSVTADRVTAFASLKAPKRQDIDKLYVRAAMIEPGTLSASATVSVPGASRVYKFKRASKRVAAGKSVKLRLKLSKKGLRAAKRALKKRKRLRARIRVTAKDNAGNRRTAKRTVRLRR
jgi:hypothetical protein